MAGYVSVPSGQSDVGLALRTARKEHVCATHETWARWERRPYDDTRPEWVRPCPEGAVIAAGMLYAEIPEGNDQFHPLRYHIACAVHDWFIRRPADGSWTDAVLESHGART